ncbi:NAD-dependent succinate-semialdehyde dehydrogenase [Rhizobium sp. R693]|uniref:NAD-dependent succinate-semialdehyde dehydrogenase n=1 Tax=Rhizobium sp. R693 TaxID=1764276 RepID=UPI000B532C74|nr:NAD-dependent succinate-semialdehyde dehydrogenase [Rhizobium sp. R693]OWV93603.1 NAD-dependent succinate-semialdehyde dehydrogenase [Rhizobium sp. R693]
MLSLKDPSLLGPYAAAPNQTGAVSGHFTVFNPATAAAIADVADLDVTRVRDKIDAAYVARPDWSARTADERCALMLRWSRLMRDNIEDLSVILTAEMGKPLAEARSEIEYATSYIDWFAEEGRRIYGDIIPAHEKTKRIFVLKQPVGVAALITPWNFPSAMIARKAAPAMAAGCSVVARPSEMTPLSALAMCVLAERAGIPSGVLSVVPSTDAAGIGAEFCSNTKVRKLSFTGSTRIGSLLMRQAAGDIKKLSLELGGNAPFVVFDDADLDKAVAGALLAKFRNAGQTCVCANRIYVQKGVYDAFAEKLSQAIAKFNVGDGMSHDTQIGPLISPAALLKVEEHIQDAVRNGATIRQGGRRHPGGGQYFEPTVLTGVSDEMKVAREETFGPVAPLFAFDTVEEVIERSNDTEFGLAAYFYTQDLGRAWRVAEALDVGMVGVNTAAISTAQAPFGGIKQSGIGREGSKYGINEYLELKYVCMET